MAYEGEICRATRRSKYLLVSHALRAPKMTTKNLKDNNELYGLLVQTASYLQEGEHSELAEFLFRASRFARGSPSEFLHEAQLALERVSKEQPGSLSLSQLKDIEAVRAQIREAFRRIGWA